MKRSKYFPFERNRYFYGKLLTVRDFESEQTYFNDKRRLINRLLFGSGIVAGLQVVAVDEKTISIQSGVALDKFGREIVVSSPVTLKLAMIEGFTNNEYAKNVYVCIAYDEKGKEPVHSVAGSEIRTDEVSEYNRMLEGYRLFVREKAPDLTDFPEISLAYDIAVLYEDRNVRVIQFVQRHVNPGEVFEVRLRVEKTLQMPKCAVSYEFEGEAFERVGSEAGNAVTIAEPDGNRASFESVYYLKAAGPIGSKAKLGIKRGGKLHVGDSEYDLDATVAHTVEIIQEPVVNKLLERYNERTLDEAISSSPDCIYLARVALMQMGPTYVIDQVEQAPFGEYVYSASVLGRMGWFHETKIPTFEETKPINVEVLVEPKMLDPLKRRWTEDIRDQLSVELRDLHVATGWVEFELEPPKRKGLMFFRKKEKTYITDEIRHGLGKGQVNITVALDGEWHQGAVDDNGESLYYGQFDIFNKSEFEPKLPQVKTSIIVYPSRGTFRIGVKVVPKADISVLRLRWWALRKNPDVLTDLELEAAASKDE